MLLLLVVLWAVTRGEGKIERKACFFAVSGSRHSRLVSMRQSGKTIWRNAIGSCSPSSSTIDYLWLIYPTTGFAEDGLTFNTTVLPLDGSQTGEIKLFSRKPLKSLEDIVRRLYVTQEIMELLDGQSKFGVFPDWEAERLIGIFCAGGLVRISRKKNNASPDLERLEGYDEIWCLCPRKPRPGWRLLGRFLEKDRLVLFRAWDKHRLARNYDQAVKEVIEDWDKKFGQASPLRATELSDYVSGVLRDVDVKEG